MKGNGSDFLVALDVLPRNAYSPGGRASRSAMAHEAKGMQSWIDECIDFDLCLSGAAERTCVL